MHFAAMTLANPFHCKLVDIIGAVTKEVRIDFWSGIEKSMSRRSALARDIELSRGAYRKVLKTTLSLWANKDILDNVGLMSPA